MSTASTDIEGVAEAVSGIQIDGPAASSTEPSVTVSPPQTFPAADGSPPPETQVTVKVASGNALFDTSPWVGVPVVDGQATDVLAVGFSGTIKFDASDEDGQALFKALALGKEVDLRVAGVVAGKRGTHKVTGKEGEEQEVVTGQATVKVHTVFLLTPETL